VELRFFKVREYQGEIENKIFKDMRWADPSELASFDFLEADLDVVKKLSEGAIR
jgi:8-oxo-dGTP diphosphatase